MLVTSASSWDYSSTKAVSNPLCDLVVVVVGGGAGAGAAKAAADEELLLSERRHRKARARPAATGKVRVVVSARGRTGSP